MSMAQPLALALLAVPALVAAAHLAHQRWQAAARRRFAHPAALAAITPGRHPRREALKAALLVLALTLAVVAVARPQWGSRELTAVRRGSDIVVALDVSQSMAAEDAAPNRLGAARAALDRLLEMLQGDRVGLVLFAGEPTVRFPLTADLEVARQVLDSAGAVGLDPGSDLASALGAAAELLTESEAASKVVILASDGEVVASDEGAAGAAPDAALQAARQGVTVYTVGVGSVAGTTIPVTDPETGERKTKIDGRTGRSVVTALDADFLASVAESGGGRSFLVAADGGGAMAELAADLEQLEQTLFAERQVEQPIERFQYFVGAVLALLVVEVWLAQGRVPLPRLPLQRLRRGVRALAGPAVALLLAAACATSAHTLTERGTARFAAGDFAAALELYREAQVRRPDLPELNYNVGLALYRLGELERAAREFRRATEAEDPDLRFQAFFALGNTYFGDERFPEAVLAYRNALLLRPESLAAKYNLELALRQVQALREAPDLPTPASQQEGEETPGAESSSETSAQSEGNTPSDATVGSSQQLEQSLDEALQAAGDEISAEEALQILDRLAEERLRFEEGSPDVVGVDDY